MIEKYYESSDFMFYNKLVGVDIQSCPDILMKEDARYYRLLII